MLKWGIMGAGGIARVFCNAARFSQTGRVVAVASQTPGKAALFASDFSLEKHYDSYEAMLADPEVEAVYVANIHPLHEEWVIKAAEAGKHILVEKPIGMNSTEAEAMIDAAHRHDVFLMEAFMYRCSPQTQTLVELVKSGVIGQVRLIRSVFSFQASFDPTRRTFSPEMGGGGILDVGCYPASMARLIAGAAAGQPFLNPTEVKGCGVLGPSGVDHYTAATLKFENEIVAEIITGVTLRLPVEATIYGDEGMISVPNPWLPSSPCRTARQPLPLDTSFPSTKILLHVYGKGEPEEIVVPVDRDLFTYEADMVATHIAQRQAPAMSWEDTLGNMRLLDRWRQEIGLVYPQDRV
ncbi:MAG: Gfo/Idh/MocA family oxidoreductase [Caldilineaceae bacterium]|nr:Gfo/Idh/MocA family oxidoreductase [Caldilineaceae bacterium]